MKTFELKSAQVSVMFGEKDSKLLCLPFISAVATLQTRFRYLYLGSSFLKMNSDPI